MLDRRRPGPDLLLRPRSDSRCRRGRGRDGDLRLARRPGRGRATGSGAVLSAGGLWGAECCATVNFVGCLRNLRLKEWRAVATVESAALDREDRPLLSWCPPPRRHLRPPQAMTGTSRPTAATDTPAFPKRESNSSTISSLQPSHMQVPAAQSRRVLQASFCRNRRILTLII